MRPLSLAVPGYESFGSWFLVLCSLCFVLGPLLLVIPAAFVRAKLSLW